MTVATKSAASKRAGKTSGSSPQTTKIQADAANDSWLPAPDEATPYRLHLGNCLEVMRAMPDNSVDAIVTDPPYELTSARPGGRSEATKGKVMKGFMGLQWDASGIAFNVEMWREALRVLKPGGHLLAFSGSRTYHRMACAIEDAGFEIRDRIRFECGPETKYRALFDSLNPEQLGAMLELLNDQIGLGSELAWEYGSGFPKSVDVSKAIDKATAGQKKEIISPIGKDRKASECDSAPTVGREWTGWGSALKPAHEPICVARKPLVGTIHGNVMLHRTGAINIDGCRVPIDPVADASQLRTMSRSVRQINDGWGMSTVSGDTPQVVRPDGRWPANVIHDGSPEVIAMFPDAAGQQGAITGNEPTAAGFSGNTHGDFAGQRSANVPRQEENRSASRFFYCAKSSKSDRGPGNTHPTVKPLTLMQYLVRLVTPPGGVVLDPFMGSGSTGKAALREGFRFVGIDMTPEYVEIARGRIEPECRSNR